jgi:hypothetical protein
MITDALRYVQREEDWVRLTIIGGLLTFFGFLLVPLFVVAGYVLRVLRATMGGEERVPGFEDWTALAVDGLKGLLVALAYFLVPAVVGTIAVGFGALAVIGDGGAISVLGTLFALGTALLALAVSLVALYVLPAALANYAETDRMTSAFSVGALWPVLTNRRYATGWVYAFVTVVAANVVINALVLFAGIGVLLAPFATFYASVMAAYIVGRTWNEIDPIETRENGRPAERPTV